LEADDVAADAEIAELDGSSAHGFGVSIGESVVVGFIECIAHPVQVDSVTSGAGSTELGAGEIRGELSGLHDCFATGVDFALEDDESGNITDLRL